MKRGPWSLTQRRLPESKADARASKGDGCSACRLQEAIFSNLIRHLYRLGGLVLSCLQD